MANLAVPEQRLALPSPRRLTFITRRQEFESRKEALRNDRQEYLEEMRDISDYIQLRRGRYLLTDNRKRRRSTKVLNEKGTFASRICGAGMMAGVSSPSRPWLKIKTPDNDLNEYASVKRWLDTCQKLLYQAFASSNYYHTKQSSFRDMADFGQGPIILDEDYEDAINTYCSPPGEYYLSVNQKGIVDTMYRDMQKTTLQIMQNFHAVGNIPKEIRDAYDNGRYDQLWDIVSVIEPNIRRIPGARGPLGMPYVNLYYALGVSDNADNGNAVLAVSGNHENAISAARWEVQPNDIYGDGCGALVLPSVKSLQVLEKRKGSLVDKMATPPLQAPESMSQGKNVISHLPGGVSYYPGTTLAGQGGGPITPTYQVTGQQLTAVIEEQRILEERIDIGYFVPLFQAVLASDRRQVTAREIEEVHEEKLIQLGPVLERTHYEGLNFEVKRTFGVLARHRVLPPPPPEMDGKPLQIEYTSLLAVAQKAIGAGPIERFSGFIGNLSAGNPDVLDKWDMDQTVDEYADVVGVPASMVRSDDEVIKIREARMQKEQAMETAAIAAQGADTAKVLSEADTSRDSNLLADIIGNQGRIV